ncbi:MAG: SpoIIE family protein phosphatase [Clostridia bacterium]|nr:SpoIIE family protein phosphatase [Clostridia bacterium]
MEQVQTEKRAQKKRRERGKKLPSFHAEQWGRALVKRLPMAGAFFLLSLAQCFSAPAPFSICCLMALTAAGESAAGAWLGLGAGLGYRVLMGLPWDAGQFVICALFLGMRQIREWKPGWVLILTGTLLLARALPDMFRAGDAQTVILLFAGVLLGVAVMPALLRAARLAVSQPRSFSQDDLLCLLLPLLLLLAGAGRLSLAQVNMGYFVSAGLTLTVAWVGGSAGGACFGLACGLTLLISGQSALPLVNLAFGALLAGMMQGKNRALAAGVYLLSSVTAAYLIAYRFIPAFFIAEGAAALLFCLIPGKQMGMISRFMRRLKWNEPKENAYTRLRTQRWVRAIECMADALPHPRVQPFSPQEESETLTDALCADCDRLPICWHEMERQTKEGLEALSERGDDTDEYLQIINTYFPQCPRIGRIPELLSRLDKERQTRMQRALCAEYERDMLQTHLTALSQAAQRISLEGQSKDSEEALWTYQTEEALQAVRFPGRTAFVKKVDGHMMVCLKYDPLALRPGADMGNVLANRVGLQLGVPLSVTEQQGDRIILEEVPPLKTETGMATACAVSPEKKRRMGRRPDNGDAVLTRLLPGGRQLLTLSDGMGHGTDAQEESKKTLELLSLCLEAGYTRSQAMTAVNGAMLSATGGEKFATVDLCVVDLWTGETAMNKLGACASYVIQGQKIHTVEGSALPLGIIEHVVPMEHRFTLGEGDTLLLMSDGVTDAFPEEQDLLAVLRRCREYAPQRMADTLLREALLQRDGLPPDDMTVLCARIQERGREKE